MRRTGALLARRDPQGSNGAGSSGRGFNAQVRRARRIYRCELGLAPGASVQELVDAIAALNQRSITIREMDLDPSVSGMCLRGPAEDRIVVGLDNTAFQRRRVLAHELGHLLPWYDASTDDCIVSGHGQGHSSKLEPLTLASQVTTLPADLVDDILNPVRSVKLRVTHASSEELAVEAWSTAVSRLLAPGTGRSRPTDAITSAFANRSW